MRWSNDDPSRLRSAVVPNASSVKLAMTVAIIKPVRSSSNESGPEPEAK